MVDLLPRPLNSLIFMYCLFVEKELVTTEFFLLDFSRGGGQKYVTEWQFLLRFLLIFQGLKSKLRILSVDGNFEILLEIYLH